MKKEIKNLIGFLILTFIGSIFNMVGKSGKIPYPDWSIFLGSWILLIIFGGGIIIGIKLMLED